MALPNTSLQADVLMRRLQTLVHEAEAPESTVPQMTGSEVSWHFWAAAAETLTSATWLEDGSKSMVVAGLRSRLEAATAPAAAVGAKAGDHLPL